MARQGHAFATAEEVRVVYASQENDEKPLRDVPPDGKTIGEVVMRGNIVMKEVCQTSVFPVSKIKLNQLLTLVLLRS